MSFLIRCEFVMDDGTVLHDETVVSELGSVEKIAKGMEILGSHGELRITFDPPLVPDDVDAPIDTHTERPIR